MCMCMHPNKRTTHTVSEEREFHSKHEFSDFEKRGKSGGAVAAVGSGRLGGV